MKERPIREVMDDLEDLEAKATPGDWWVQLERTYPDEPDERVMGIYAKGQERIVETDSGMYPPRKEDAKLIVALRNALPLLMAHIRVLEMEAKK